MFKILCRQLLGKHLSKNYEKRVQEMLEAYRDLKCNMSLKIYFMHSHLPKDYSDVSDEHG